MLKKKMSLSIIALIGSMLLFISVSLAWFAVSTNAGILGNVLNMQNIDVTAVLYESDDATNYTETTSISMTDTVPGSVKYYKVVITNNNDFAIFTQSKLYGFTDNYAYLGGDTSNYAAGKSMLDILLINASNNVNSESITDQTMTSLLSGQQFINLVQSMSIDPDQTVELYFSFTVSSDAGNDYQNLSLEIEKLLIMSTS